MKKTLENSAKTYNLTKEELHHFASLDYARNYLEHSQNLFIESIVKERLNIHSDKPIAWKLEQNKLIVE